MEPPKGQGWISYNREIIRQINSNPKIAPQASFKYVIKKRIRRPSPDEADQNHQYGGIAADQLLPNASLEDVPEVSHDHNYWNHAMSGILRKLQNDMQRLRDKMDDYERNAEARYNTLINENRCLKQYIKQLFNLRNNEVDATMQGSQHSRASSTSYTHMSGEDGDYYTGENEMNGMNRKERGIHRKIPDEPPQSSSLGGGDEQNIGFIRREIKSEVSSPNKIEDGEVNTTPCSTTVDSKNISQFPTEMGYASIKALPTDLKKPETYQYYDNRRKMVVVSDEWQEYALSIYPVRPNRYWKIEKEDYDKLIPDAFLEEYAKKKDEKAKIDLIRSIKNWFHIQHRVAQLSLVLKYNPDIADQDLKRIMQFYKNQMKERNWPIYLHPLEKYEIELAEQNLDEPLFY